MGLFDLFGKKEKLPELKDLVWKNANGKFSGLLSIIQKYPDCVLISWFAETQRYFGELLRNANLQTSEIKLAKYIQPPMVENKTVIFLEHYPLRSEENKLIQLWNTKEIFVLNSLDEPIFEAFGGSRIVGLMESLGLKDDEQIEHPMITKSIKNAQEKLQQKVTFESTANSAKDWFQMNIVSK